MNKTIKNILNILLTFISTIMIFGILVLDLQDYKSIIYPMICSLLPIIFYTIFTYDSSRIVKNKLLILISVLFGGIYAIGKEYLINDCFLLNFSVKDGSILCIQILLMSVLFYVLASRYLTKKPKPYIQMNNILIDILYQKNIKKIMLIMFTCWVPYFILMYPCFIQADSAFELAQVLGIPNLCSNDVMLINPNQLITQHHSIIYTYLLGLFAKIDINIGLYILNVLQTILIIFAISKMIIFLSERIKNWNNICYFFMFLCVFPFFPFIFTILEKDALFCGICILFFMELYKFLNKETYNPFIFIFTSCLLLTLRNNFKYAIIPFVIILLLIYRKKIIGVLLISLILTNFGYQTVCQVQDITPGSKAEAYAVPILQVSKCVLEYPEELTTDDIKIIDKVLEYDKIEDLFNPKNVDYLKASYARRKPSNKDIHEFFELWLKIGMKHPLTYIESFLNKTMGYFYQFNRSIIVLRRSYSLRNDITTIDYSYNWEIKCSDFGFVPNDEIIKLSNQLDKFLNTFFNFPIIGLLTVSPTYIWIMFFTFVYLIKKRDYQNLLYMLFLILYFGTILLSPVDGMFEFRYIYPIFVSVPIFLIMKEKHDGQIKE